MKSPIPKERLRVSNWIVQRLYNDAVNETANAGWINYMLKDRQKSAFDESAKSYLFDTSSWGPFCDVTLTLKQARQSERGAWIKIDDYACRQGLSALHEPTQQGSIWSCISSIRPLSRTRIRP
jgi:hypothetical protein